MDPGLIPGLPNSSIFALSTIIPLPSFFKLVSLNETVDPDAGTATLISAFP
jgi:hypothetical protein